MLSEVETKVEEVLSVQQHVRHNLSYGAFSAWAPPNPVVLCWRRGLVEACARPSTCL